MSPNTKHILPFLTPQKKSQPKVGCLGRKNLVGAYSSYSRVLSYGFTNEYGLSTGGRDIRPLVNEELARRIKIIDGGIGYPDLIPTNRIILF